MSRHLGLAFIAMLALVSGLFAENEQKAETNKSTWDANSSRVVEMSDEEWANEGKKLQKAAEDLQAQTLRVQEQTQYVQIGNTRRWIERRGGWGIAADFDFALDVFTYKVGGGTLGSSMFQVGPRIGIAKRFQNIELRALTGAGFTAGDITSFYVPFGVEVGYADSTKENPSTVIGLSYTYSPQFSKTELYVTFYLGTMAVKLGYGFAGGINVEVPTNLSGGKEKVMIDADGIYTIGLSVPLTFPL